MKKIVLTLVALSLVALLTVNAFAFNAFSLSSDTSGNPSTGYVVDSNTVSFSLREGETKTFAEQNIEIKFLELIIEASGASLTSATESRIRAKIEITQANLDSTSGLTMHLDLNEARDLYGIGKIEFTDFKYLESYPVQPVAAFEISFKNPGNPREGNPDLNMDGIVDSKDQALLLAFWGNAPSERTLRILNSPDVNEDGTVNAADLAEVLGSFGKCTSLICETDLNGDQIVNAKDTEIIEASWNSSGPYKIRNPDLDNDGTVGPKDLAILLGAWTEPKPDPLNVFFDGEGHAVTWNENQGELVYLFILEDEGILEGKIQFGDQSYRIKGTVEGNEVYFNLFTPNQEGRSGRFIGEIKNYEDFTLLQGELSMIRGDSIQVWKLTATSKKPMPSPIEDVEVIETLKAHN